MNKLPKELLLATSLNSRSTWVTVLCHLVWFRKVLGGAHSWTWWSLWVLSNLRYTIILSSENQLLQSWISFSTCQMGFKGKWGIKTCFWIKTNSISCCISIPLHTLTSSHHSRGIRNLLQQMHLGWSLCIGLLVAQGFVVSLPPSA